MPQPVPSGRAGPRGGHAVATARSALAPSQPDAPRHHLLRGGRARRRAVHGRRCGRRRFLARGGAALRRRPARRWCWPPASTRSTPPSTGCCTSTCSSAWRCSPAWGWSAYSMVRTTLWPLAEIELTAAAIGRGDLGRRVPDHHPGTEMGRLSRALNAMLEQIERAFGARAASEARARRPRSACAGSWRTPATSCARRSRRSGGSPSSTARGRSPTRTRCHACWPASRARPSAWACWSTTCCCWPASTSSGPWSGRPWRSTTSPRRPWRRPGSPHPSDRSSWRSTGDGDRLVVDGDEPRLRQVVGQPARQRARLFAGRTPVTVRVAAHRRDDADLATAEVIDHGPGLTPEQAERVFERFYRVDAARSRALGGTGLGLSIVAAIAAAHGGTVEVDSAPGDGCDVPGAPARRRRWRTGRRRGPGGPGRARR